jgi:purine-binding chemotaxis protein CheW
VRVSGDDLMEGFVYATAMQDEILRRRAESLAVEQIEQVDEQRVGVLLFALGEEWYGVRVSQVREIHNEYLVTSIPCVPDYIAGVVNIRGEIVSVTDLRMMMGLGVTGETAADELAPLIVIADETVCTALMVDGIGDIAEIAADAIEPPLAILDRAQADYISGTFYVAGRLVALVNLPRVLTPVVSA